MLVIQGPGAENIPTWHAYDVGEILHTDGVKVTKPYIFSANGPEVILFSRSPFFMVVSLLQSRLYRLHGNKLGWNWHVSNRYFSTQVTVDVTFTSSCARR